MMKKIVYLIFFTVLFFQYMITSSQHLEDKTIVYFGDSISAGNENYDVAWYNHINQKVSFKFSKNDSKPGATFSNVHPGNMIIDQLNKEKDHFYDYIIVQGGVNDVMANVTLGKMNSSYNKEDFDDSTFIGSIDLTFYYLTKYFEHSSIGVIITYPTPNAHKNGWADTSRDNEYFSALIQLCEKWHIPYIDFYNEYKVVDESLLLDGLHLNDIGYRKTTPYLIEFIQQLEPYTYHPNEIKEKNENRLIDFYHIKKETSFFEKMSI